MSVEDLQDFSVSLLVNACKCPLGNSSCLDFGFKKFTYSTSTSKSVWFKRCTSPVEQVWFQLKVFVHQQQWSSQHLYTRCSHKGEISTEEMRDMSTSQILILSPAVVYFQFVSPIVTSIFRCFSPGFPSKAINRLSCLNGEGCWSCPCALFTCSFFFLLALFVLFLVFFSIVLILNTQDVCHQVFNKQWNSGGVYWLFSSSVSFWLKSFCSLSEETFNNKLRTTGNLLSSWWGRESV